MDSPSVRTLFITRRTTYPPMGGAALRNWQNINIMKKYGEVGVFSVVEKNGSKNSLPGVELYHCYNLERSLSRWEKLERQAWWLRLRGYPEVDLAYAIAAERELDQLLAKFQPDLVVVEQLWLYRYLSVAKRYQCHIICDAHNVEAHVIQQRYRLTQAKRAQVQEKIEVPKLKFIERDFVCQADQVWVCSQDDANLLQQWYRPVPRLQVVPNGINVAYYDDVRLGKCPPPSELENKDHTIIFVGSLFYPPNIEAARLLIRQIYPKLQKIYPNCRLLMVGSNPPERIQQEAKDYPGIIFTAGKVPDVRLYLAAASIVIVPLLHGGGTRFKILEAFAAGRPVVSTAKGAEGLKAKDGEHLLIRNEVEELVEGVCQIWSNTALGEKIARSAYQLVKAEYSWEAVGRLLEPIIQGFLSTNHVK